MINFLIFFKNKNYFELATLIFYKVITAVTFSIRSTYKEGDSGIQPLTIGLMKAFALNSILIAPTLRHFFSANTIVRRRLEFLVPIALYYNF